MYISALFAALSEHTYIGICLVILMILSLCFFARASFYVFLLKKLVKKIGLASKGKSNTFVIQPSVFQQIFSADNHLSHLWNEYQKTLHTQSEEKYDGFETTSIRATVPAELFFSTQSVVDHRVGTEFFKHFPGIFTGIGIIGTFTSLITGLQHFRISDNTEIVRNSLENLMHLVSSAFTISAFAITIAMIVTFIEKFLMTWLYKLTENIAEKVDENFVSGVGEEYLSRLVQASDNSSTQIAILRDQLVSEFDDTLRQIKENQIETVRTSNQKFEETVAKSLLEGLHAPMQQIAASLQTLNSHQSTNTNTAQNLQRVLSDFVQKLDEIFSGQITNLNEINKKTTDSIGEVVVTLKSLEEIDNRISQMMGKTDEHRGNIFRGESTYDVVDRGNNNPPGSFDESPRKSTK